MVDAREFHRETNHTPRSVRDSTHRLDPTTKPHPFERYRNRPTDPLASIHPPQHPALAAIAHSAPDPLADPVGSPDADPIARPELDRETLATICYEAAGVTQQVTGRDGTEHYFRAASCTGNLHHVDCYAICGDLPDLDAGVYHFDPATFALDVLREDDYRQSLADAVGDGDTTAASVARAPVTLVATSEWARNAWKYRDRTYRHAFWDAGTILANGLAAAHALDLRVEVLASFADDRVATLLGVEPGREAPLALLPIDDAAAGTEPVPDTAPEPPVLEPIDPAVEPATDDPVDTSFVHDAWRQSALRDGTDAAAFRRDCRDRGAIGHRDDRVGGDASSDASNGASNDASSDVTPLDPVDAETASARPLHATIRRRGSCREYADRGPTWRQVATVLDRALRPIPGDWRGHGDDATAGLAYNDPYLLATGIEGLDDGAYHLRPADATLRRIGDASPATKTHLALDQEWAGAAHANVYLLADVDAVVAALGNRGYRLAQLEAGIALGRLYLATDAHRALGGTGLTFFDDLVADALAPQGSGQTPTTLFAFGRRGD